MSGVRNGGFEQTLRNVCLFHIEQATGQIAFTEADKRGDLVLRSLDLAAPARSTRCEFKTNFACQRDDIEDRSEQAIGQATPLAGSPANQDGIVVYAVAELVFVGKTATGIAERHNAYVRSPRYKLFRNQKSSDDHMEKVRTLLEAHSSSAAVFESIFSKELWLDDKSGFAKLHVWTYYITAKSPQ